eukprot:2160377-Amphidinium_carterae.1
MAFPMFRQRQIQEHTDDVFYVSQEHESHYESGPLPGLRAGRGAHKIKEKSAPLGLAHTPPRGRDSKNTKRRRASLSSLCLFDMVAELAIAERVIGLASLLASIVVTRA